MAEIIAIACDHGGVELKTQLVAELESMGFKVEDLGTHGTESVDYPDYGDKLARAILDGQASRGVVICGSGIGISIAANRHMGIRAALCHDATTARLSRQHNDANVLALGARVTGIEVARECVRVFFTTEFEGGRHVRRIEKLG